MLESTDRRATSKYALVITLPLAALISCASLGGLLRPEFYARETADWVTQTIAQDMVDLFLVVPVLLISGLFVHRGERLAEPIWGGSLLYIVYTFIIYCFAVHFNSLFLVYVATLGTSAWAMVYFVRHQDRNPTTRVLQSQRAGKVIGIYFIIIAVLFCCLWLTEILPAILAGEPPATMVKAGLVTNPVQVIDLSFFLPGILLTGVLLIRNHRLGLIFTPVLLVFFVLMDITIAVIFAAQQSAQAEMNLGGLTVMVLLAFLSLAALLWFLGRSEG